MSICMCTHDLPLGVSPTEVAALVCGPERAANDIIILVATETEHSYAWDRSMWERFLREPTPEIEKMVRNQYKAHVSADISLPPLLAQCMARIDPTVSPLPVASLSGPADSHSVAESLRPLKPGPADKQ